jgi:hypothetical protein
MNRVSGVLLVLSGALLMASCNDDKLNKVPVAEAGPNQTITLPTSSVNLTGTGADADGQVVAYLWSQVSGPAASTIVNPGSASTAVQGLKQGSYIFQLMVTDDMGATGVDTTRVTVNPGQQQTLTLQPANNPFEYHMSLLGNANASGVNGPDIPVAAWTVQGTPWTLRQMIKFDLSSIPTNATILSANLYLYTYPPPLLNGNFQDANFGTNNTMFVQRVTSNWTPGSAGWFNQPTTDASTQVVVPHTNLSQLDLNIDVKNLVASMVNGNANYGFLLRLQNENYYTSRIFVGSHNTTYTAKHPKLVVTYQ